MGGGDDKPITKRRQPALQTHCLTDAHTHAHARTHTHTHTHTPAATLARGLVSLYATEV